MSLSARSLPQIMNFFRFPLSIIVHFQVVEQKVAQLDREKNAEKTKESFFKEKSVKYFLSSFLSVELL